MEQRKTWIPHDYQSWGLNEITKLPACALFWRPGTGKTVTALTAADDWLMSGGKRVLIVAPKRVALDTWAREAAKWAHTAHLEVAIGVGSQKVRKRVLEGSSALATINVENWIWAVDEYGDAWPWDMVIIDEYSGFKDYSTKRVKAAKKVRSKIDKLVGLTGSPSANGYEGLYSMVGLLDNGKRLGRTLTQFRELWMEPDARSRTQVYSWRLRSGKREEMDRVIEDICFAVPAEGLPEITYNVVPVALEPEERESYEELEREYLLDTPGGVVTVANAAVLSSKLMQLTGGRIYAEDRAVLDVHNAKFDALDTILAEAGGPVLVFYAFKSEAEDIARRTGARELRTPADIAEWNAGQIPVAVMHPQSAYGLNLQDGGCTIVWFTLTWSQEFFEQANARLARQGQKNAVIVHLLCVPDSVDEDCWAALQERDANQARQIHALDIRRRRLQGVN